MAATATRQEKFSKSTPHGEQSNKQERIYKEYKALVTRKQESQIETDAIKISPSPTASHPTSTIPTQEEGAHFSGTQ